MVGNVLKPGSILASLFFMLSYTTDFSKTPMYCKIRISVNYWEKGKPLLFQVGNPISDNVLAFRGRTASTDLSNEVRACMQKVFTA